VNDDGRALLAVVVGERGSRIELRVGFNGRLLHRGPRQLDLLATAPADPPAPSRLSDPPWRLSPEGLKQAAPQRRELGAAWLLLVEDPLALPLEGFVSLIGDGSDPAQRAACWLWLQGPQTLFRWRHGEVDARPLVDVRHLRREARRQRLQEASGRRWQAALRQRQPICADQLEPGQREQLALLRGWAAGDASHPLPDDLHRALKAAHCHPEPAAIRHLLVDLGQWDRHHLPSLERTTWEAGFSPELEAEAARLLALADGVLPGDEQRWDLTGLHTVTIDDEDTLDIDDGLSLQSGVDGQRLWIHIADPGRLVAADTPLDLEARRRGSSLYLARGALPMFPDVLSSGPFSLRMGQRCPAWSVWVSLADDGAVAGSGFVRSWVRPAYRLSYEDADDLIELAPPPERQLSEIHALMVQRRRWRMARGAISLDQPEGRIRCRGDEAQLEITEPSPSRTMVAEAMILAGAVIASHGQALGLPLPYRSQLPADLPPADELQRLPLGPVRHAAIRRCLSRGHLGTRPAPHFSLGLPCYVQVTSPIRRYGDLLAQRQLLAQTGGMEGEKPLSEAELGELILQLERAVKQGVQISREDQRHWQQVWFERQQQCQWNAVFLVWLKPEDRLGLVHVEDLGMSLRAECPTGAEPADPLILRVLQVDSLRDQLRLRAVR
jgi:exoribonuclease-2